MVSSRAGLEPGREGQSPHTAPYPMWWALLLFYCAFIIGETEAQTARVCVCLTRDYPTRKG